MLLRASHMKLMLKVVQDMPKEPFCTVMSMHYARKEKKRKEKKRKEKKRKEKKRKEKKRKEKKIFQICSVEKTNSSTSWTASEE